MLGISILTDSAAQAWPPFVLVAGLLLIGRAASADGLFEGVGAQIARAPLSPRGLLVSLLTLVAVVTAVLNLDTSVVFLTPVLIHAARQRQLDERPFLYGVVFMSNAASLLLPGSNLTNLLILRSDHVTGAEFAARMLPAWLAAFVLTTLFLVVVFPLRRDDGRRIEAPHLRVGAGVIATVGAGILVLALPNAALPVLTLGLAANIYQHRVPRLDARALAALFALAVVLGTIARAWHVPSQLLAHIGSWPTAGLGVIASILLNNLPAAMLLSAHAPPHPRALLLGLDIGPNLAVTGSLSAILWLQAARAVGANPSIRTYSRLGLPLVVLTIVGALSAGMLTLRAF